MVEYIQYTHHGILISGTGTGTERIGSGTGYWRKSKNRNLIWNRYFKILRTVIESEPYINK